MNNVNFTSIDFAELYGVLPGESDFSGAIERSSRNVNHLSTKFIESIQETIKERKQKYNKK